jgi:hypothetical protein
MQSPNKGDARYYIRNVISILDTGAYVRRNTYTKTTLTTCTCKRLLLVG